MAEEFDPLRATRCIWNKRNQLPLVRKAVLACLVRHAGDGGFCYPSQATLAKEASLSDYHVRTVLKDLEAGGFLRREKRPENLRAYCYWMLPEPLYRLERDEDDTGTTLRYSPPDPGTIPGRRCGNADDTGTTLRSIPGRRCAELVIELPSTKELPTTRRGEASSSVSTLKTQDRGFDAFAGDFAQVYPENDGNPVATRKALRAAFKADKDPSREDLLKAAAYYRARVEAAGLSRENVIYPWTYLTEDFWRADLTDAARLPAPEPKPARRPPPVSAENLEPYGIAPDGSPLVAGGIGR